MRDCLHDQWLAERDAWPEGPGYMDYARFVAGHPRIFGKRGVRDGACWHLVTEARRLVLSADGPAPTRWEDTKRTSPSGKTILRCLGCETETVMPINCRARCDDAAIFYGWPKA